MATSKYLVVFLLCLHLIAGAVARLLHTSAKGMLLKNILKLLMFDVSTINFQPSSSGTPIKLRLRKMVVILVRAVGQLRLATNGRSKINLPV